MINKILAALISTSLLLPNVCVAVPVYAAITHTIVLSDTTATYDGATVKTSTHTWTPDPSNKNGYTETDINEDDPMETDDVYIAKDIIYYPSLPTSGFTRVQYDENQEWAYYYDDSVQVTKSRADGVTDKWIFSTLPVLKSSSTPPTSMMHTATEAASNPVLHIKTPGTYVISGTWTGQIMVNLPETGDANADEISTNLINITLNGVTVNCSVAPAFLIKDVYETESTETCGVNITIADGTTNNFTGANVYRMLKMKDKDADAQSTHSGSVYLQKKLYKLDGAFYSSQSMKISGGSAGTGILNINGSYEGLSTEMHLHITGGNIYITTEDDGINVNEEGTSIFKMSGGNLNINCAQGDEGDGIDSNGSILII